MEDAFQISNIYINRYRVLHEYLRRLREVDPDSPAFYWVAEKYSRQIYEFKKKGSFNVVPATLGLDKVILKKR